MPHWVLASGVDAIMNFPQSWDFILASRDMMCIFRVNLASSPATKKPEEESRRSLELTYDLHYTLETI